MTASKALSDTQDIDLHLRAAEQLERAAHHHREAARCHRSGEHDAARYHAYLAEGYCIDVGHLGEKLVQAGLRQRSPPRDGCSGVSAAPRAGR